MTASGSLLERLSHAADQVDQLIAELAAADELITELVAENEQLRRRLGGMDSTSGSGHARPQ